MDNFQDTLFDKHLINRLKKEVKKQQLKRTISEISYFNRIRSEIETKYGFNEREQKELDFIKKLSNARKKYMQI